MLANKWRGVDAVGYEVGVNACGGNDLPQRKQGTISILGVQQLGGVGRSVVVRVLAHKVVLCGGLSRAD